ncbi:MAG TPA: glycosyltransferase, partial [Candidatus Goldiibacteriota bacterium]|nr:glycosyltransferase [Candidatus Goldiibacteriota bacterium]
MKKVSIIIPAYNEEKRLPATLLKIKKFLKKNKIKSEIIVIDDGS